MTDETYRTGLENVISDGTLLRQRNIRGGCIIGGMLNYLLGQGIYGVAAFALAGGRIDWDTAKIGIATGALTMFTAGISMLYGGAGIGRIESELKRRGINC